MITIINKTRLLKAYQLDCAIPVKYGKKVKINSIKADPKNKQKAAKRGGMKIECDRVLTLVKGEKRENLPDAVSQSKSIIKAKLNGEILVKVQKSPKKSAKKFDSKGGEAKPQAASSRK